MLASSHYRNVSKQTTRSESDSEWELKEASHQRRFHGMDDAKEIWAAIKTRFGGNANSKKMQKAILKQQFEAFTISSKESLEKGYDRSKLMIWILEEMDINWHCYDCIKIKFYKKTGECKFKVPKEGAGRKQSRAQEFKQWRMKRRKP
ncbi:hypothetical protein Tco_1027306 [Tanacetum coccineum]